jgi:hypothetical protein
VVLVIFLLLFCGGCKFLCSHFLSNVCSFFVVGLLIFGYKFPSQSLGPSVAVFTLLGVSKLMLLYRQTPAPFWNFYDSAGHWVVNVGSSLEIRSLVSLEVVFSVQCSKICWHVLGRL